MQYEEALQYIHSLEKFGIKPGMERITALCRAFGNVQEGLRYIHVAGTNGKGSTSTMLANICRNAGYKTGLFISPYVLDFRERIQVDGEMIPKDALAQIIERIRPVADALRENGEPPTEFEVITAAAFLHYARQKCDMVVLETGLGGRLDSTNIIPCPEVSVITSVSLDHMAVLGNTVAEIAAEKCGILKDGGTVVTYPFQDPEALEVIRRTAEERRNTLIIPDGASIECRQESIYGTDAVIDGLPVHIPMLGRHMVYNASMAVAAARALGISDEAITKGIADSRMPARMEILREKPLVILDGGHNEDCANALRGAVTQFLPGKHMVGVCGLMADKAYERYLSIVAPLFDTLITVTPQNPRSLPAKALCEAAQKYCPHCTAADSFSEACAKALEAAGADGAVIACGSFYMAADLKKYF
ncbi:MAG: bifunctional folylpolyglutamate synthase/dihydrofolate synthase [Acutalibacteraceae bacterium]